MTQEPDMRLKWPICWRDTLDKERYIRALVEEQRDALMERIATIKTENSRLYDIIERKERFM